MAKQRSANALPDGHELNGFRIERELGHGGFGITYLAEDIQLKRWVAIKEYLPREFAKRDDASHAVHPLNETYADDFDWGLDRFRLEAETLVSFRHPNIVAVYQYFLAHGTAYLVMEYQDGKTLAELLAGGATLEEDEILEFVYPLLAGLEEVHRAGFMHRDIKPENIFIRKDGKPVLIDFGAARQETSRHSKALTSIVSAGYAPYEQYGNEDSPSAAAQGPWTDIYALGATLYRCVTGNRPEIATGRLGAIAQGKPDPNRPAVDAAKGKYSNTLLVAIDTALQVLEGNRPQSVQEFRAMLKGEHQETAETAVNAVGAPPATAHAAHKVGPDGQPVAVAQDPPPAREATASPLAARTSADESRRSNKALWITVGIVGFLLLAAIGGAGAYFLSGDEMKPNPDFTRKTDPQPDPKPDLKPDLKPDPKPDIKPDPKPDPNPTKVTFASLHGKWCSERFEITMANDVFASRRLTSTSGQPVRFRVARVDMEEARVRVHFINHLRDHDWMVFEFEFVAPNPQAIVLRRIYSGEKWATTKSEYRRPCR